jgi:hypothetical protein
LVIGKLAWKPFDVRFDDILQSLEKHRETICLELHIAEMEKESEERTKDQQEWVEAQKYRTGKRSVLKVLDDLRYRKVFKNGSPLT